MDTMTMLLHGFSVCFMPANLLACIFGVILGTIVGVLPGIGTIGAIALLLPFSYSLDPITALIMFCGIYYGSKYGGSTTSILLNMPGETASVITCLDGFEMAKRGRAGAALAVSAIGSFVAGTLGVVGLTLFAPMLAQTALVLGPPEYFAIAAIGLIILIRLTGQSSVKSLLMMTFGFIIGTIGLDTLSGASRFTFHIDDLERGIDLSLLAMGIFGIGEILTVLTTHRPPIDVPDIKMRDLYPTKEEYRRSFPAIVRGSITGFLVGLLPGPSGTTSTFASYALEKKVSKHPEEFGHGAIEGVASPEAANNSANSATMIPLLTLGLPFCGGTAILLSGLMIHGVSPGPSLITDQPDLFWGVIASMYLGNLMLLIINLPLVGIFVKLLKTPLHLLMPLVIIITLTGAFAVNTSTIDLMVIAGFGLLGFFLNQAGFETTPLIIGIVIGPELEQRLVQGLIICNGDLAAMLSRPLTQGILSFGAALLALNLIYCLCQRYRKSQNRHIDKQPRVEPIALNQSKSS